MLNATYFFRVRLGKAAQQRRRLFQYVNRIARFCYWTEVRLLDNKREKLRYCGNLEARKQIWWEVLHENASIPNSFR